MSIASTWLSVLLLTALGQRSSVADKKDIVEIDRPGEHNTTIGQTVHFIVRYDGFSGRVFTGLEVTIDGKKVETPEVESRPDRKMVDVGQVIFIHKVEKAGSFRIVLTPLTGQTKGKAREYVLKVSEKK